MVLFNENGVQRRQNLGTCAAEEMSKTVLSIPLTLLIILHNSGTAICFRNSDIWISDQVSA